MLLPELDKGARAIVQAVVDHHPDDAIARRLRALGFVPGEPVRLLTRGPFGGDPLLVQVGFTRFALRRDEASRIHLEAGERA